MKIERVEVIQIETPRYYGYVSGHVLVKVHLDDRFLSEMKSRFADRIRLKSLDFSGRFTDWETALRYADAIRHHDPFHFEQPTRNLRVSAEFTKRVDLPVTWHIGSLQQGYEAADLGACTAFNVACVSGGPTPIRRLFALAESAGLRCLIGTDQESIAQVAHFRRCGFFLLPNPHGLEALREVSRRQRDRAAEWEQRQWPEGFNRLACQFLMWNYYPTGGRRRDLEAVKDIFASSWNGWPQSRKQLWGLAGE